MRTLLGWLGFRPVEAPTPAPAPASAVPPYRVGTVDPAMVRRYAAAAELLATVAAGRVGGDGAR